MSTGTAGRGGAPRAPSARLALPVALVAAVFAVYHGTLRAEFVYDDRQYLLLREHLRAGLTPENVAWAFTSFYASNWHPLTWLSHLLDLTLFGTAPPGHHAVNLLLHALNTLLLLRLLTRLTGAFLPSALAAALFALHPLHVESVAWVAERKDLLSAAFFLLALEAYRRYAARPAPRRYLAVGLLFVLGLLSKPMVVTLPAVLLLIDWWPLGRLRAAAPGTVRRGSQAGRLLLEKAPLFLLAVASAAVTVAAQRTGGSMLDLRELSLWGRISNAAIACATYLGKTLLPTPLAVFYPLPDAGHPAWQALAALLLLVAVSGAVLWRASRRPWLATGWLWYLVMLTPVLGLVQVGRQSHADRYTYLPLIGVFIGVLWELKALARRAAPLRRALAVAVAVLLPALALLSHRQTAYWKDERTLFTHAQEVTGGSAVTAVNLATLAVREGRLDEAEARYREALGHPAHFFEAVYGLAEVLARRGDAAAAATHYRKALGMRPQHAEAWFKLAVAETELRRYGEAAAAYRHALALEPALVEGHMNLGNVLSDMGRLREALAAYAEALRLDPARPEIRFNRGLALERAGRWQEAGGDYREALRLSPDYPAARLGLARVQGLAGAGTPVPRPR